MADTTYEYPRPHERYVLVFGIVVCFVVAGIILKSGSSALFVVGAIFLAYIGLRNVLTLIISLRYAPSTITIRGDKLILTRPVGLDLVVEIQSISSIRYVGWLDILFDYTIIVTCQEGGSRFFINARLVGLGELVGNLTRQNNNIAVVGEKLAMRKRGSA